MKKIIYLTLTMLSISCSNNDDNDNNSTLNNFVINKVYISPSYSTTNCWKDLVITDGDFTETDTEYIQNDNIKNFISFNDLVLPNCEIEPGMEFVWDLSDTIDPNNGMEGPNIANNINIQNHVLQNINDLSEYVVYAKFKFISQNSFEYTIKFANGQILNNTYTGSIITKTPYKDMGIY